ncbi:hypothetical protein UM91_18170 [Pseudomonas oryzihabitans]|nr:hypothetical protein UM91_18170 [Pseudomonas oryzihabitans]
MRRQPVEEFFSLGFFLFTTDFESNHDRALQVISILSRQTRQVRNEPFALSDFTEVLPAMADRVHRDQVCRTAIEMIVVEVVDLRLTQVSTAEVAAAFLPLSDLCFDLYAHMLFMRLATGSVLSSPNLRPRAERKGRRQWLIEHLADCLAIGIIITHRHTLTRAIETTALLIET